MQKSVQYRNVLQEIKWNAQIEDISHSVADWLCYSDSLTKKLMQYCTKLKLNVISEGWLDNQWQREVIIKCGNSELIFAHTVLPKSTIDAVASHIPNLGNHAIGLWLFEQNPQRKELKWGYDPINKLYARQSHYLLAQKYPLTISELFLSDFPYSIEISNHQ